MNIILLKAKATGTPVLMGGKSRAGYYELRAQKKLL
jgi:hypothetical protein